MMVFRGREACAGWQLPLEGRGGHSPKKGASHRFPTGFCSLRFSGHNSDMNPPPNPTPSRPPSHRALDQSQGHPGRLRRCGRAGSPGTGLQPAQAPANHWGWQRPLAGKPGTGHCRRGMLSPSGMDDGRVCTWLVVFLSNISGEGLMALNAPLCEI